MSVLLTDIPDVSKLSALSPAEFAAIATSLLPWIDWRIQPYRDWIADPLKDLLVCRLTTSPGSQDNPLVFSLFSFLDTPLTTPKAAGFKRPLLHQILGSLPKDRIEPYRAALVCLATSPTEVEKNLSERSAALLEFLDASQAWVPCTKHDDLGIRMLELVETAEMQPLIPGMLEWLQDRNWPPFRGCWTQLARFPELAIDSIREVLRTGDDGCWKEALLNFLESEMPVKMRERGRVEVERIAQQPTQDEIENDAWEAANDCLKAMDDARDKGKILGRKLDQRMDT
ncbi:hypothetical protein B0H11DRAFT_1948288 [Mycena galericulata]|nr:hypothetical protein B0H11DRAFT_1948288 [Mycena galericulata]